MAEFQSFGKPKRRLNHHFPKPNRPPASITAGEIRTHLTILDNHGKVLTETVGVDGEIHIKRYAPPRRKLLAPSLQNHSK
jgi:hypothetical protein